MGSTPICFTPSLKEMRAGLLAVRTEKGPETGIQLSLRMKLFSSLKNTVKIFCV